MSRDAIVRQILTEIERDPAVSQKRLADRVGISVGMINWHIKRCVSKGLIKLQDAPVRRYLYYLTPEGFTEKARLTAEYLAFSFEVFRTGRQQYEALFRLCLANDWRTVAFLGESELVQLASMVLSGIDGVDAVAVIDPRAERESAGDLPVTRDPAAVLERLSRRRIDALIGTHFDLQIPGRIDRAAIAAACNLEPDRVLVPAFLQ